MWFDVLIAARWSFRQLAFGVWLLVIVGAVLAWVFRWIMDDSR